MRDKIDPFDPPVELAATIRRHEVSPVEVADCYLDRIDELDPPRPSARSASISAVCSATTASNSAFRAASSSCKGCSGCGIPEPNHDHKADASTDATQINGGRDWLPPVSSLQRGRQECASTGLIAPPPRYR